MIRRSLGFLAALFAAQLFGTTPAWAVGAEPPAPGTEGAQPAPAAGATTGGQLTLGGQTAPTSDTGVQANGEQAKAKQPEKLPWHGSVFFVDQSATTQTVGLGGDYQSRNPTYELWYSFRPRYYVYESDLDSINLQMRLQASQELTNNDSTTKNHEFLIGDTWFLASYDRTLYKDKDVGLATKLSLGPRFILGTSKTSSRRGKIGEVGAAVGLQQQLPLAGPKSDVFPTMVGRGSLAYTKGLNRCTTACNPDFEYTRQDTGGRTFVSNQLSGSAMVNHQLIADIGTDFQIFDKLGLSLDYIWVMQWMYPVGDQNGTVGTTTGAAQPGVEQDPQNYRVGPWFATELDYDLIDEVGLSLGYYNYTNQLGPDGTRRNPLWSPDARVFFTITANLDKIYETATGRASSGGGEGVKLTSASLGAKPAF
jgi:hypothetical protein